MTPSVRRISPGRRLRELLAAPDEPLVVYGVTSARVGEILDRLGARAGFVGTGITLGSFTGLPDRGVATATECVQVGRYLADAVTMPLLLDGDTGHGGPEAVKRLTREAIRAGLAGIRIDDQPLDDKRATLDAAITVADRDVALQRYSAAVQARDEYDPEFVVMAQCYARDARNGGLADALDRMSAYQTIAGVDWSQFESPHSLDEVAQARSHVRGWLSVMQGRMAAPLSIAQHKELGLDAAWYTFVPGKIVDVAVYEFLERFLAQDIRAWLSFTEQHDEVLSIFRRWKDE